MWDECRYLYSGTNCSICIVGRIVGGTNYGICTVGRIIGGTNCRYLSLVLNLMTLVLMVYIYKFESD